MEENQQQIPEGWELYRLGDILEYEQPYKYTVDSTEYDEKSGIPVLTAGKSFLLGFTQEKHGVYVDTPVIIFDDFTTDSKFVDFPFKVKSSAMKFLKPKAPKEIDIRLVFGHIQKLRIRETGGDHKRRWISEFSKLKVALPSEPSEQTQIANILSKVDEAISQTEQLIAKYTRIKTGLMQDLLTKGIDQYGNIRSEQTHQFKDSPLGRIPKEWENVKVADLGDWKGGKTPSKSNKKYWEGAKNLWYSSKDIVSNLLSDSFYKISDAAIFETNQKLFPAYRSLIFVFRSGILRHTFPVARSKKDFSINQDIKALIPHKKYQPEFLYYLFKSIEPVILSSFVKAGTTVESIDGRAFFDLSIGIPNEQEQIRIQVLLVKLDSKLKHSNQQLSKLQSLKTGLMQDLLSGKVRVNHLINESVEI